MISSELWNQKWWKYSWKFGIDSFNSLMAIGDIDIHKIIIIISDASPYDKNDATFFIIGYKDDKKPLCIMLLRRKGYVNSFKKTNKSHLRS